MNFIPKMNYKELIEGYKKIIQNIYTTRPYYKRLRQALLDYNCLYRRQIKINLSLLSAFFKSVFIIGILDRGRCEYWKLVIWTLFNRPGSMIDAITYAVYGYHFRTIYGLRSLKR
jgi:hypothetical protein